MAFPDDVFPPDDCCEICGGALEDEIVIQEFADGSLARLCPECAAGAAFGGEAGGEASDPEDPFAAIELPDSEEFSGGGAADPDALDKTKELLLPVTDLIGLQREMQGALERLASSLERFAAEVITESIDKTATVESRLQTLERELEKTRSRLQETEFLLTAASAGEAGTSTKPAPAPTMLAADKATPDIEPPRAPTIVPPPADTRTEQSVPDKAPPETWEPPADGPTSILATSEDVAPGNSDMATDTSEIAASASVSPAIDATAGLTEDLERPMPAFGFLLEEVRAVQRHFNDSPFTGKTRDVQRSLGKPRANLTKAAGKEPMVFLTIAWDIVWYQYIVDLRPETRPEHRVSLFREGMDLGELADQFREKNATINDDGRVDASELEVRLLSDPAALITELSPDQERALEDATEEIWDHHIAPEFKWDD